MIFVHLIRKKQSSVAPPWFNPMILGCLKHKSREGDIRAVRLFKHRLSVARISHLLSLLVLSNTFASVDHVDMDDVLTHVIEPEDHDLEMLRYRDAFSQSTAQMVSWSFSLNAEAFKETHSWLSCGCLRLPF